MDNATKSMAAIEHAKQSLVVQLSHCFFMVVSLKLVEKTTFGFEVSLETAVIKVSFGITAVRGLSSKLCQVDQPQAASTNTMGHKSSQPGCHRARRHRRRR